MDQKTNTFLETEPIGGLMRKYAVPCVISFLVAALYNIVDQIFIANASYLGSCGNAANTVVFPLTVVALATVLGQVLTAALSICYLCHMKAVCLELGSFRLRGDILKRMLPVGICSFLSQISLVAAMAAGCIPIVGYNIGAGRKDRAKKLFTCLLISEAAVGAVALLIVELMPGQLIALFGAANESVYYTEFAVKAFRIYLCMMIMACVNKGTFIYLQSLGKAFASTTISMVREVVFGVGSALLLPRWFGLDGVLYSMLLRV